MKATFKMVTPLEAIIIGWALLSSENKGISLAAASRECTMKAKPLKADKIYFEFYQN